MLRNPEFPERNSSALVPHRYGTTSPPPLPRPHPGQRVRWRFVALQGVTAGGCKEHTITATMEARHR